MPYIRSLLVWLVIMATETVNGICREVLLKPFTGEKSAKHISFLTALALIMAITCLFIRWIGAATIGNLFAIGVMWSVLTVLFEGLIVRPLAGISWDAFIADYNLMEGNLMTLGLLYLIVTPLIAAKIRKA